MMHEISLQQAIEFNEARKEDAIERCYAGANIEWRIIAERVLYMICRNRLTFTADNVWHILDGCGKATQDHRALGAVMRYAARSGWCATTDRYIKSKGKKNHRRPIVVWKSLLVI